MREGTLFAMTKDHLETGLRGVPVGYCVTSLVDPYKGLSYVGRPIAELAFRDPLEVIYLLYYGEMGTKEQVAKFHTVDLSKRAELKKETLASIEALPLLGNPMDAFAAALLLVGMHEGTNDYREDCLNVIAKLPQIAASVLNRRLGWGAIPASKPDIGYIENFSICFRCRNQKLQN